MYALLAEANGFPISSLTIHAFLRDWSARNAMMYRPDYPDQPFYSTIIPLWSMSTRKEFLTRRLQDHKSGLRECTPEEKWQMPDTWAVKKQGVKRALRVLDTEQEALSWLNAHTGNKEHVSIECRPGSCRRCEEYCFVRSVCEFNHGKTDHDN
jgi:hypothetical protein